MGSSKQPARSWLNRAANFRLNMRTWNMYTLSAAGGIFKLNLQLSYNFLTTFLQLLLLTFIPQFLLNRPINAF
jgi:hypothetical protein